MEFTKLNPPHESQSKQGTVVIMMMIIYEIMLKIPE